MTFSMDVAVGIYRGLAALIVALGTCLTDSGVPDDKFCRAAYLALSCFSDTAASLGKKGKMKEVDFHVDLIVSGLGGNLNPEADPLLSAWMFYDGFARGLQDRL